MKITFLTLEGRSLNPLSLLRPPRPRRNPLSWSSILDIRLVCHVRTSEITLSFVAWWECNTNITSDSWVEQESVHILQLEDGFEESSWWRESQPMQKIYHTYIPFYLWSQHVVLRWFMWSILADRICELISLDVWSQLLHATVNVCRTYYLLVLLWYFSCGFEL